MAEFTLIDLRSQMPYLPSYMRFWSRERFLNWLRIYGQVQWFRNRMEFGDTIYTFDDEYFFRSWVERETIFSIHESSGELSLHIPGTNIQAWEHPSSEASDSKPSPP